MSDVFRNNNRLKDEDIAYAAGLVCQAMIASLPDPEECRFTFSARFERKMEILIKTQKRQGGHRAFVKWVLTVLLSILVSAGIWLTVDVEARAAVMSWIREIYEDRIIYRSSGKEQTSEIAYYTIKNIPARYRKAEEGKEKSQGYVIWEDQDNENDMIIFDYSWNSDSRANVILEYEKYTYKQLMVGQHEAEWYESKSGNENNLLIWVDEEREVIFSIDSHCSELDILHMAESIELMKK